MASAGEAAQRDANAAALKVQDATRSPVTTELLKGAAVILLLIFCLVWVKSLNQHLALEGPTPKSSSSPTATAGPDQP